MRIEFDSSLLPSPLEFMQGNTVAAMGSFKGLKQVRRIIEDCIQNKMHPIYHIKVQTLVCFSCKIWLLLCFCFHRRKIVIWQLQTCSWIFAVANTHLSVMLYTYTIQFLSHYSISLTDSHDEEGTRKGSCPCK